MSLSDLIVELNMMGIKDESKIMSVMYGYEMGYRIGYTHGEMNANESDKMSPQSRTEIEALMRGDHGKNSQDLG